MVADLLFTILGADFLKKFNLLVDVRKQRFIDGSTFLPTPTCVSTNTLFRPSFFIAAVRNQFHSLLVSFPELVDPKLKSVKVMYSTRHHVTTSGPIFSHP